MNKKLKTIDKWLKKIKAKSSEKSTSETIEKSKVIQKFNNLKINSIALKINGEYSWKKNEEGQVVSTRDPKSDWSV